MKKVTSIDDKMSIVRPEMKPHEYTDRKISEITLDSIIIHYNNTNLNSIPENAIKRIRSAIKPDNFSKKYEPQVFIALEKFEEEKLDFFKDEIIEWLKLVIDRSNIDKQINRAVHILTTKYWIEVTIGKIKNKVNKALSHQELKENLFKKIGNFLDGNQNNINKEENYDCTKWKISNLLLLKKKVKTNSKTREVRLQNTDIYTLLLEMLEINPELISENMFHKIWRVEISEFLEQLIIQNHKIKDWYFHELEEISGLIELDIIDLLKIVKYRKLYSSKIKIIPFTLQKITAHTLDTEKLFKYLLENLNIWPLAIIDGKIINNKKDLK